MSGLIQYQNYDVIVLGGGASGIVAAVAASQGGARTALIEKGTAPGGELLSGMAVLGSSNSQGEWLIGGPAMELITRLEKMGGFVGRPFDGRTMWGACVDPEAMKLVIPEMLSDSGVVSYLGSAATDVVARDGRVHGLVVEGRNGPLLLSASTFVDASGDAFLSKHAGAEFEYGAPDGTLQPMSLMFRASDVDFGRLLEFVRDHPEEFMLGESDILTKSPAELAQDIYDAGIPFMCLQAEGEGTLLRRAIDAGDMYPTTGMYMYPTSVARQELCLNTTRLVGVDPFDTAAAAEAMATLSGQIMKALTFLRKEVPGFADANLSGVAPRIGIRETRRIVGEDRLETDDVVTGRKRPDVVAKGGHHIDIHGSGTDQHRVHVKGGRSYDIPFGALVPQGVRNVMVSGRCFSSSREANGSARHMGSCLAMGQAAGTAAAMSARQSIDDVRLLSIESLQKTLRKQGAILDGVA